ncbi:hypothetical protein D3C77_436440 [compost metagenome]
MAAANTSLGSLSRLTPQLANFDTTSGSNSIAQLSVGADGSLASTACCWYPTPVVPQA